MTSVPSITTIASSGKVPITDEQFVTKLRLVFDLWKQERPWEVREYLEGCKQAKDQMRTEQGYDRERAGVLHGRVPEFIAQTLRQSEWETKFQYGVPCGLGMRSWDTDDHLYQLFLSEMPESRLSSLSLGRR